MSATAVQPTSFALKQQRTILKQELLNENPQCHRCGRHLSFKAGQDDSAIVVPGGLVCPLHVGRVGVVVGSQPVRRRNPVRREPEYTPGAEEITQACEAIKSKWTPRDFRIRRKMIPKDARNKQLPWSLPTFAETGVSS